jgi:hypothetical protein
VAFFHLHDLENAITVAVKFCLPFEDFTASPLPGALDAYLVVIAQAVHESGRREIIGLDVGAAETEGTLGATSCAAWSRAAW